MYLYTKLPVLIKALISTSTQSIDVDLKTQIKTYQSRKDYAYPALGLYKLK